MFIMKYHIPISRMLYNTKTGPLNAILNQIQRNPHTYMEKAISNERDDNKNTHSECKVRNNL